MVSDILVFLKTKGNSHGQIPHLKHPGSPLYDRTSNCVIYSLLETKRTIFIILANHSTVKHIVEISSEETRARLQDTSVKQTKTKSKPIFVLI